MSEEPAPSAASPAPPPAAPPAVPPPPAAPGLSPAAVAGWLAALAVAGFLLDAVLAPGGGRPLTRREEVAGPSAPKPTDKEKERADKEKEDAARRERSAARVFAPGAHLEKIVSGLQFTEGPAAAPDGSLYFTDIPTARILRWTSAGGVVTFTADSGGADGLAFDRDGHLIACETRRGRVVAYDSDARATVLADTFDGKRFNSPNDLWVDPRGGIYFTDPLYEGARSQQGDHVYYLAPDGSPPARVTSDLTRPNGVVGTTDGTRLLVNDEGGGRTYAYKIAAGGALTDRKTFARAKGDGMKLDAEGKVFVAAHDGVRVYDSRGRAFALISVPEIPTNLCFAGPDRKTLIITARSSVYAAAVRVAGAPLPPPPPPAGGAQPAAPSAPSPTAQAEEEPSEPTAVTAPTATATPAIASPSAAPAGRR